jgi:hypothetical protein
MYWSWYFGFNFLSLVIVSEVKHEMCWKGDGIGLFLPLRGSFKTDWLTDWLTHSLTPCGWVLKKLTVTQLDKKLPAFYGTRRFITVFTPARHRSLSWARWIQSIHSNIIFPSMPRTSKRTIPFKFCKKRSVFVSHLTHARYIPQTHVFVLDSKINPKP